MGIAYRNIISLNADEAVIAGILRNKLSKFAEVFVPVNLQLKDVDLLLLSKNSNKILTIQVKGSRAYEPSKNQIRKWEGSAGWFFFKVDTVLECKADLFIFLIYVIETNGKLGRRILCPHSIIIPTVELKKRSEKYKKQAKDGMYNFIIWVDPKQKRAFDIYSTNFDVSDYLDDKGTERLKKILQES